MPKSYRFKTKVGVDREVRINIEQDFDYLEILSLKLRQEDLYNRFCADYGVVAGRVVANGGLGIPNVSLSIFVPIDEIDENDPVISTLYPYKTPYDRNEDNYRYNLLPYTQEYGGHTPTGTFPTREDLLTRSEVLEVYEKYYRYTVRTNNSGDFMIVGVPLGQQKLVMDLDLSNIGTFSLRPSDLIRMGMGVPDDFNGQLFKSSEDLNSLPQIINNVTDIEVNPFWGQEDLCNVGITRFDFDLRDMGVNIEPHSIFMGSIFSSNEDDYLKARCKPKKDAGKLCNLTSGPGQILCIRQTNLVDSNGDPILEEYKLEEGGNIIDENGVWITELPMNLDYVTTNEFGEQIISDNPENGVATSGKYRFRIKWQNEGNEDDNSIYRADYLVPNVKEHGWVEGGQTIPTDEVRNKSYAFSLDWNDYFDKESAINCEDTFYRFRYNKVYTVSSHVDKFKWGTNRRRFLGIKDIEDKTCQSEINRYPVNDGFKNSNFNIFIFNYILTITTPLLYTIIITLHVAAFIYGLINSIITILVGIVNTILSFLGVSIPPPPPNPLLKLPLPMITYPDCEPCNCKFERSDSETPSSIALAQLAAYFGQGALIEPTIHGSFGSPPPPACNFGDTALNQKQLQFVLSGYDNNNEPDHKYVDLYGGGPNDHAEWYKSPVYPVFNDNEQIDFWGCSPYTTWAQSLNQMNSRAHFWGGNNISSAIQTTLINDQFGPNPPQSEPFLDNVFILVMDSNTNLSSGDVISFNNPSNTDKLSDPNINSVTLSSSTIYNENGYIPITIKSLKNQFIDETEDKTIYLFNTGNTNTYQYTVGVEYLQVITGYTGSDIYSLLYDWSDVNNNILSRYLILPEQRYGCNNNEVQDDSLDGLPSNPTGNLASKYGYENMKVYFLVRGVDLHTPRQKIRYDLSKVFGYHGDEVDDFTGDITVEGNFYMNIPIQRNTPSDGWFSGDDNQHYRDYWRKGIPDEVDEFKLPSPHHPRRFKMPNSGGDDFRFLNTFGSSNLAVQPSDDDFGDSYTQMDTPNLYHQSYTLQIEGGWQTAVSRFPAYYVSLDGSFLGPNNNGNNNPFSKFNSEYGNVNSNFSGNRIKNSDYPSKGIITQLYVAGVGYQYADADGISYNNRKVNGNKGIISMSPSYLPREFYNSDYLNDNEDEWGIPRTIFTSNNNNLIFRSDRLPMGDIMDFVNEDVIDTEDGYFRHYALHMNAAMTIYKIEDGIASILGQQLPELNSYDESFNLQDEEEDLSGTTIGNVMSTFSCQNMKPFDCYEGVCDDFNVNNPCTNEEGFGITNITGDERVVNGCYIFLVKAPIFSLPLDLTKLIEYRARLRFNYALCQGIINQSFFNNWVSGSLYLPSFQNKRVFDTEGDIKKYKYCGSPDFTSDDLKYQGPIYRNTETNSFYYRSTPYNSNLELFVGQVPTRDYEASNKKNIWFPTTITELGPKDEFSSEISLTSEFQGYVVDKIRSTSYNDTSDIINLFAISRLTNSSLFAQLISSGDASVDNLFSRDNKYVDGDFAQLTSINSEFGVIPFLEGNYEDNQLTFCEYDTGKPVIGIWFDSDIISRRKLGEGINTIGTNVEGLTSTYGYENSQTVPYYKWKYDDENNENSNLFGTELNDWYTTNIFENKHQGTEFFNNSNTYMFPDNSYGLGYIYNKDSDGNPINILPSNPLSDGKYKVGSPFHFYFGLNRGKTAINKYIRKYILFE